MHTAIENNNLEIVNELLTIDPNVNFSIYNITPLLSAIQVGNIAIVERLIKAKANIENHYLLEALKHGSVPIFNLLNKHEPEALKAIIAHENDQGPKVVDYDTLLNYTSSCGNCETINFLIENKADIRATGLKFMTPLMAAIQHGHLEAVKLLIILGCPISKEGYVELNLAAHNKHYDLVIYLLQNNISKIDCAELNRRLPSDEYQTCDSLLNIAIASQDEILLDIYLKSNPIGNLNHDISALAFACTFKNIQIVDKLIAAGCPFRFQTDKKNEGNNKARDFDEQCERDILTKLARDGEFTMFKHFVENYKDRLLKEKILTAELFNIALINMRADIAGYIFKTLNMKLRTDDESHMQIALSNLDIDSIKMLLQNGAPIPKHHDIYNIVQNHSYELNLIEFLIKNGCDVNAADKKGLTLLMLAVLKNEYTLVRLLIGLGADPKLGMNDAITYKDNYGKKIKLSKGDTPLHVLASKDDIHTAALLLRDWQLILIKNASGYTPYRLAKKKLKKTFDTCLKSHNQLHMIEPLYRVWFSKFSFKKTNPTEQQTRTNANDKGFKDNQKNSKP